MSTIPSTTISQQTKIRILDDIVVNQIAAGEVVERPSSVVKELVENSLDAGATEITVAITNGGKSSIEVIDNGCGMLKDDALLSIERFGTSKISSADDLLTIHTHGFRGEAIPSIAAISRFKMSTQVSEKNTSGLQIIIDGGKLKNVCEGSFPPGTRIEVKHLFFNVPARKKFLRADTTETNQIRAILTDFALAYPKIRLTLIADGKEISKISAKADFFTQAKQLKLAGANPISCNSSMVISSGEVKVSALLSSPIDCVTNSGGLRLLVNSRSVRDKLILRAIRDGFGNFLKPGRYPTGVLALEIPPEEVDVNVHPQKTEVRFRRTDMIFTAIIKAVQNGLKEKNFSLSEPINFTTTTSSPFNYTEMKADFFNTELPTGSSSPQVREEQISYPTFSEQKLSFLPEDLLLRMKFIGQVFKCYLIFEGEDKVALVDMHAAHERVMFYQLKSQLLTSGIIKQMLLIPEKVTIPFAKMENYEKFQPILEKLGLDTDAISDNEILVRSCPSLIKNISAEKIFSELCALPEWSNWGEKVDNLWDQAVARLACHSSVRSGRELGAEESYKLLEGLKEADNSGFCPHGRPIVKLLDKSDFELMFGRRQ
ncbi:MAG: DNA mismatch repair endonuclease MutL [Proteobacteria bacterium]|nr:DNA mismatch repair endonuclease MutL [Pseudomonadota bacterium]